MLNSISIWNFIDEENDIVDLTILFTENGFDAVSFTPESIFRLSKSKISKLKSVIDEKRIPVTIHADFNISTNEIDKLFDIFDNSLKCISLDPRCKIDQDGNFFESLNVIKTLEYLIDKTESKGILFGLEDFPLDSNALKNHSNQMQRILKCPRYGILLDLGHMNLRINNHAYFKNKGIIKYITDIPVKIIELHVHDNDSLGDKHMPPGKGVLDYNTVVNTLKELKFNSIATLEIAPKRYNSTPTMEIESAIQGVQFWRNMY
ncbi:MULTISPECIES: TIM barrel protein [Thermococcus]|uniref:TIM barrel protein n=1 Tax=Thermococcus TaxID=2263 RepID=UPI00064F2906|nr:MULTISPECIES: TIM barrel protein [Thermococcus]MBC7095544.1 sugar phosphate isomerase/epimerase [Thermococcus sp.]